MVEKPAELVRLKSRLAQARRAWKRNAALAGAVVVVSETAGIVGIAVLADILFAPGQAGRLMLLGGAVAVTAYLTARHILTPLLRKISDQNLALYLEERTPAFEGSLIAAVEFGDERQLPERQAQIVRSILHEAVARVERFDLRKAIDFSRFRKYAVMALLVLGAYGVLAAVMPETVARHVTRVVAPWKKSADEAAPQPKRPLTLEPISITLSRQDTSLLRGSAFDVEATLSRKPENAVYFHFRAYDTKSEGAAWKQLPMKAADRLNGFDFALPDVNEDLEFFVSSGAHKSAAHRINVHDPLALVSTQVTVSYPEYVKRKDATVIVQEPEVAVLTGSTVTLRFETNLPLKEGRLVWPQGQPAQPLQVDAQNPAVATVSFPVTASGVFDYHLVDVNGQTLESPMPVQLRALDDKPPRIKLLTPEPTVSSHPLGDIAFSAEVGDDYGVSAARLVYYVGLDPAAQPQAVALPLTEDKAHGPLMLESLLPTVRPGDMLTCFLECTDLKGQKAVTDLVLVTIRPFDLWAAWIAPEPAGPTEPSEDKPSLTALLQVTWSLNAQKPQLPPVQFRSQSEELAASMVDPQSNRLRTYVDVTMLQGQALEHARKAIAHIDRGRMQLQQHATDGAIGNFRAALGELALAGLADVVVIPPPAPPTSSSAMVASMKQLDAGMQVAMALAAPPPAKAEQEAAADKEVADLQEKQQALAGELKKEAGSANPPGKSDSQKSGQKPDAPAGGNKQDGAKADAGKAQESASEQRKLAEKAQKLAETMKQRDAGDAASKMNDAARTMHEAAKALEQGDKSKGAQKAEDAARLLAAAAADTKTQSQDRVARALDEAERKAKEAKQEQGELLKKTEELAKQVGQKQPDAGQQREMNEAAKKQVEIAAKVDQLAKTLEGLKDAGERGELKPDAAKQLDEASLGMKRQRVPQRAANAAVEIAAGNLETAVAEQTRTEKGLEKVLDSVRAANDARATGHEAELKRAKQEADRIKEAITKAGDKGRPESEKRDEIAKAADEAQRLARHLNQRDLLKGDPKAQQDAKRLGELAEDPQGVQAQLQRDPEASEFAELTGRLQNRLEAEYQSLLAAKKLFASQREECPPEYRRLVNQYFEALSNTR